MKNLAILFVIMLLFSLSSCQAIGDIFKAGMGFGIFMVILVVGVIVFIISKVASGGK